MDISRFENESNTVYNFRQTFVQKYKEANKEEDINNIIKYSKIAANIKFKGCTYDNIIYEKVKGYL
jgi:hypothetical protein